MNQMNQYRAESRLMKAFLSNAESRLMKTFLTIAESRFMKAFMILQDVAQEWDVQAIPTFIFIKDGKAVDKFVGANKAELEKKVAALATQEALVTQA